MDRSEVHAPNLFEEAHILLDEVGGLLRRNYPKSCGLVYQEGSYFRECPVDLGHLRVGLSPEMRVIESECSICRLDPEECDHIPGEVYGEEECLSIITKWEFEAVALVANPRWQITRFTSLGVGTAQELTAALGVEFRPGTRLTCNRCLTSCGGLNRHFEGATHG